VIRSPRRWTSDNCHSLTSLSFRDDQTRNTDVNFRTAAPQQRDSAMQELDAASMFGDLPDQVLGATANNDVRY
jgi:hypothetical protein